MPILEIDETTAAVALEGLAARGNDLVAFARALEDDWTRYAARSGRDRHLLSTRGHRYGHGPENLDYMNSQLLQPGIVPPESRPISERFLRGRPLLCAELVRTSEGWRLETVSLRLSDGGHVAIDRARGVAVVYLEDAGLPEAARIAAAGRRLGDVVRVPGADHLTVRVVREATSEEIGEMKGGLVPIGATTALAIETEAPGWTRIGYEPIENGDAA